MLRVGIYFAPFLEIVAKVKIFLRLSHLCNDTTLVTKANPKRNRIRSKISPVSTNLPILWLVEIDRCNVWPDNSYFSLAINVKLFCCDNVWNRRYFKSLKLSSYYIFIFAFETQVAKNYNKDSAVKNVMVLYLKV